MEDNIVHQMQGVQRNSTVFHLGDGQFFYCYKSYNDTSFYFRCTEWRRGCPCRAIVRISDQIFRTSCNHNHALDLMRAGQSTERLILINQARRLDVAVIDDIFFNIRGGNGHVAQDLSRHRLYPAMIRARLQQLPKPSNLLELKEVLDDPQYRCITATSNFRDNLYRGSTITEAEGSVILFISRACRDFCRTVPSLFLIKTPVFVNQVQHQVLSIACLWERNVVSLGWILMENDSLQALLAGFALLRNALVSWSFLTAVCGAEIVSRAFEDVFNCSTYPSLYDHIHDVKDFSRRVFTAIDLQDQSLINIVQLCSALPMIPTDCIQIAINMIIDQAVQANNLEKSTVLFHHLETRVIRANFSVNGSELRTHFGCELLKQQTSRKISTQLNFYSLTRFFVNSNLQSECKISLIHDGKRLPNKVPVPISCDERVKNFLTASLSKQTMTYNLLQYCSQIVSS